MEGHVEEESNTGDDLDASGWLLPELDAQVELLDPEELVGTLTASFNTYTYIYIYFTTFNNNHSSQIPS